MTRLICLANSWKHGDRCIAGINPTTGQWIRPVFPSCDDGRIPEKVRLIQGTEPALLDILEIPLEESGPDFGFSIENRTIQPGEWHRLGQVKPGDLLPYCPLSLTLLHNPAKSIPVSHLQSLPLDQRCTLQLVYVQKIRVQGVPRVRGGYRWRGELITPKGQSLADLSITDPVFLDRLESGYRPSRPCLVTLSLSMPFQGDDLAGEDHCWKLIAAVMELSEADLVLVEMQRLHWSVDQGRNYLQSKYGKRSRQHLTPSQLTDFLNDLRSFAATG